MNASNSVAAFHWSLCLLLHCKSPSFSRRFLQNAPRSSCGSWPELRLYAFAIESARCTQVHRLDPAQEEIPAVAERDAMAGDPSFTRALLGQPIFARSGLRKASSGLSCCNWPGSLPRIGLLRSPWPTRSVAESLLSTHSYPLMPAFAGGVPF